MMEDVMTKLDRLRVEDLIVWFRSAPYPVQRWLALRELGDRVIGKDQAAALLPIELSVSLLVEPDAPPLCESCAESLDGLYEGEEDFVLCHFCAWDVCLARGTRGFGPGAFTGGVFRALDRAYGEAAN